MDRVRIELTLGRHVYDQQVSELRLRRSRLPGIDRLEVVLPVAVPLYAEPGDDVELSLDAGEGPTKVFRGTLTRVVRGFSHVELCAHDGAHRLATYRPSLCMVGPKAGEVIRRVCGDVEVETGTIDDGPSLARYVADGRSTAVQVVVDLAALFGASASFDGEGRLHVAVGTSKDVALRYGRELVDLEGTTVAPDATTRSVVGEGADAPGTSRALWIAKGGHGGATPGPTARRRARPLVRTTSDAEAATTAWASEVAAVWQLVRLRTWLVPEVAPGMSLQLQDVPSALAVRACDVTEVEHVVSASRGAYSRISGHATASASAGGGLGAALGAALGGGL